MKPDVEGKCLRPTLPRVAASTTGVNRIKEFPRASRPVGSVTATPLRGSLCVSRRDTRVPPGASSAPAVSYPPRHGKEQHVPCQSPPFGAAAELILRTGAFPVRDLYPVLCRTVRR